MRLTPNITPTSSTKSRVYRSVIDASTEILTQGYEQSQEAKEFLNFAEQQMFAVMNDRAVSNVANINDVLIHAMERIDQRLRGTLHRMRWRRVSPISTR